MSSANARLSVSSTIALPPYLITTTLPWNSLSHGSASVKTSASIASRAGSSGRIGRVVPHRGAPVGGGRSSSAGHVEYALFSWT